MSSSDGGNGRRSARERSAEARRKQAAADRRRKQIYIGVFVVGILALAALIGILALSNKSSSNKNARNAYGANLPFSAPSGVSATPATADDPGGIGYGKPDAKVTLDVYEDVRCPYCKLGESLFGATAKEYADAGKIKIQYHIVDLIDRNTGGQGSLIGGATLACSADAGQADFIGYHDLIFKNQPDETSDAYGSVDAMLNLASQVPGLRGTTFDACSRDGKYAQWVKDNYAYLGKKLGGSVGTPDYWINGTQFSLKNPAAVTDAQQTADFKASLDLAIAKAG